MKYRQRVVSTICIICVCFLIMSGISCENAIPKAHAAKDSGWRAVATGKIIDIDPMYSAYSCGMMFHFDKKTWIQLWNSNWKGDWPSIGEVGTMYSKNVGKKKYWKWVQKKPAKKLAKKPTLKTKIQKIPKIKEQQAIGEWQNVYTIFPETNKIVVVRFTDNKTSTAYLTNGKEWKLDINKDKYQGGRTIINIKEWKDAGL